MPREYNADSIEVLSGLDPVRKRPGMYTDTSRPNHLALEVIDNSIDEALAGHASCINVEHYKDGSISVSDDGRGMPIDIHLPVGAVMGIYTQENGQGMVFEPEDPDETPPEPPKGPKVVLTEAEKPSKKPSKKPPAGKAKPSLRVVK